MSAEIHTLKAPEKVALNNPAAQAVAELVKEFDDVNNPPVDLVVALRKENGEIGLFTVDGASFIGQVGLLEMAKAAILKQNLKG